MDGFNLVLEEFCKYCGDFEEDVEIIDISCVCDKTKKCMINISCKNIDKCIRLKENLENK